jgi:cell wall-associated NlpC family hydrolase
MSATHRALPIRALPIRALPTRSLPTAASTLTRAVLLGVLSVGLVLSLGLSRVTTPSAHAAPDSGARVSAERASGSGTATRAERKAKKRKKARVRARKAQQVVVRKVVRAKGIALAQRGDSYGYGATGPNSFDCSGLVQFAYSRAGFPGMPRTSGAQAGRTRRIAKTALRPGDLMFFANGGGVYHVGMFVGRGRGGVPLMVHSSRPGTPVSVSMPWTSSWFAGTVRPA